MSPGEPGWRDEAAAGLAADNLSFLAFEGPALVMLDRRPEVPEALEALGLTHRFWHRRALGGTPAAPWPPEGPFGAVLLRIPRAKQELEMALHAGLARLDPGGRVVLYGANDEGARSAARLLQSLAGEAHTVATGGRCRVVAASRPDDVHGFRGRMEAWRLEGESPLPGLPEPWISYPGVFAHGRLDEGTALLVEHLPDLASGARVLDFGSGSGVVGAALLAREPGLELELLDADALALEAAKENVPGARTRLSDGLEAVRGRRYRAVVSNPPYHRGKDQSTRLLRELAREVPGLLDPDGVLVVVTQRRLATEDLLRRAFRRTSRLADRGPYRVWEARPR